MMLACELLVDQSISPTQSLIPALVTHPCPYSLQRCNYHRHRTTELYMIR